MAEVINTLEFGERVDSALTKDRLTRRWLMEKLKEYDVILSDTQLSNRCTGYIQFVDEEMKAIEKVFKKHKIDF